MQKYYSSFLKIAFGNIAVYRSFPSRNYIMKRSMSGDTLSNYKRTPLTIGTHNGVFHSDEALACYLLKVLHPEASIIRTRDSKILEECDIVIDVGGSYDPERNRFDHHQKSFEHSMSTLTKNITCTVKLSSAGLIYHHFGRSVLKELLHDDDEDKLEYIYKQLYLTLIREIDGVDNGIPAYEAEPLYDICTDISAQLQRLNKPWNFTGTNWDDDAQFQKAVKLIGREFLEQFNVLKDTQYPARNIIWKAIENRFSVHASGEIIELSCSCPWKNHFFELEEMHKIKPEIKYIIFGENDNYRVQCVSITPKSYLCRKFLPEAWRGLRDEELSKVAGIEDCIFAHANGFIGGNKTQKGALQMAIKSLIN